MSKRIEIPEAELRRLYEEEKLSQRQIAEILGCGRTAVQARMREYGIQARSNAEAHIIAQGVDISEAELRRLYVDERLSQRRVAENFGCHQVTVLRRMQEHSIKPRSRAKSIIIAKGYAHERRDFDGNLTEKAYLIGFVVGDCTATKYENGLTIVIECSTTKQEQIELFEKLFKPYGHVHVSKPDGRGKVDLDAHLNSTFSFLLDLKDEIPAWILAGEETFFAFWAGYIDAEGSIGIYRGYARLRLNSYDVNILHQAHAALLGAGIMLPKPKLAVPKGHVTRQGIRYNQDLWYLESGAKATLLKLFARIAPYLKHAKRVQDMHSAIANIRQRNAKRAE